MQALATEEIVDANGKLTGETIQSADIEHYIKQSVTGWFIFRGLGGAKDITATWYLSDVRLKDGRVVKIREVMHEQN